ncbi:hypothetical protein QUA74_15530 [Microcoleus sp. LAD1_D3]|uniref:hypothetical protein n=1 Tax=Microcoleus sp. LAD1_D3 TaxID=2819365 RepID=UPI002FD2C45C
MNSQTRFPVDQNIEKLYQAICEEIYPNIKNQKKGVLSTVIYIILGADNSQAQEVCQYLKIKDYALLEDDLSISDDIIGVFISNPNSQIQWIYDNIIKREKEFLKNTRKLKSNLGGNDMKLFQIVVIGCLIVGTFVCIKYLEKVKKERQLREDRKIQPSQPSDSSPPHLKVPVPVALCLVVPASVVGNLTNNSPINVSDIEKLIDNSLYFLCTSPEDADTIQPRLELTGENITTVSEQREIYVRINITDGEDMIGKKVPYILKRNLPPNGQGMVTQLACLKYLSVFGLENFNRI